MLTTKSEGGGEGGKRRGEAKGGGEGGIRSNALLRNNVTRAPRGFCCQKNKKNVLCLAAILRIQNEHGDFNIGCDILGKPAFVLLVFLIKLFKA